MLNVGICRRKEHQVHEVRTGNPFHFVISGRCNPLGDRFSIREYICRMIQDIPVVFVFMGHDGRVDIGKADILSCQCFPHIDNLVYCLRQCGDRIVYAKHITGLTEFRVQQDGMISSLGNPPRQDHCAVLGQFKEYRTAKLLYRFLCGVC